MMTAQQATELLMLRAQRVGISLTWNQANTLRRASKTLHRWAELECGDSNAHASFAIERDEETDIPYMRIYPHHGEVKHRYRVPDREKGAQKRIAAAAREGGFHVYYQGDPRGCPLYISAEPLTDSNYNHGLAIA